MLVKVKRKKNVDLALLNAGLLNARFEKKGSRFYFISAVKTLDFESFWAAHAFKESAALKLFLS